MVQYKLNITLHCYCLKKIICIFLISTFVVFVHGGSLAGTKKYRKQVHYFCSKWNEDINICGMKSIVSNFNKDIVVTNKSVIVMRRQYNIYWYNKDNDSVILILIETTFLIIPANFYLFGRNIDEVCMLRMIIDNM